jgi:glycosyltransferase involved in cell wall biosynthesis
METPTISVIIPTRNAARFLPACIQSVKAQQYPTDRVTILVVDNFSTDKTELVAKSLGVTVHQLGPERSAQRNFGAAQSDADLLLFLDADMTLAPDALRACADAMRDGVAGAFIAERVKGRGFWVRVRDFERSFYDATPIDAVRCIRRRDFLDVGGYDKNLFAAEDWDLDRRLAAKGRFVNAATRLEHNEENFSLAGYLRKKSYYATNFDAYFAKWGRDAVTQKQFGFTYRYLTVYLENGKWKQFISHPVLVCAMYFLRFMIGVVYLRSRFRPSIRK